MLQWCDKKERDTKPTRTAGQELKGFVWVLCNLPETNGALALFLLIVLRVSTTPDWGEAKSFRTLLEIYCILYQTHLAHFGTTSTESTFGVAWDSAVCGHHVFWSSSVIGVY